MAAIGKIRKHGVALMIIIGIALLAFIVGDLTQVLPSLTNKDLLVKVGDETIRMDGRENTYTTYYEQNKALLELLQNKSASDQAFDQQVHDITWAQIKEETMLNEQLAALGISINDQIIETINSTMTADIEKILMAMSNNQGHMLSQSQQILGQVCFSLLNQGAGLDAIKQIFENIDEYRSANSVLYNVYKAIERLATIETKENAYFGMANNAIYFSNAMLAQLTQDNTAYTVQVARIPLRNPAFNTEITIDENEAKAFFKANIDRYITTEEMRDIDYAVIPILPTENDQKSTRDTVYQIFNRFVKAQNINSFVKAEKKISKSRAFNKDGNFWSYNGRTADYVQVDTLLYLKPGTTALNFFRINDEEKTMPKVMDSVINHAPAGTLLTPYFDANNNFWYFGKVRDVAYRPDSIQVSFMSIDYTTEFNTQSTRTKEAAKSLTDSIQQVIAANPRAIFSLRSTYNPQMQGDSVMWITDMPDTLYNMLMATPVNGCAVQERNGEYLIVEVLAKTAPVEKRQYVLYSVPLEPSRETIDLRRKEANALAAECTDVTALNEVAKEKGIIVVAEKDVKNMQGILVQSQLVCRDAVSWAYDSERELGDVVLSPLSAKYYNAPWQEAFIVAGLKQVRTAGKPSFENVKSLVEADMKKDKEREWAQKMIEDTLAKVSMQDVARSFNSMIDSVTVNFSEYHSRNIENIIIGQIAAMPVGGKESVITSPNAVYIVKVLGSTPCTATENPRIESYAGQVILGNTNPSQLFLTDLEKNLKIRDRRHYFYRNN